MALLILEEFVNSLQGHCFVALCVQRNDNHLLHHVRVCMCVWRGDMCGVCARVCVYSHTWRSEDSTGCPVILLSALLLEIGTLPEL